VHGVIKTMPPELARSGGIACDRRRSVILARRAGAGDVVN
jgi:hypothetical protein